MSTKSATGKAKDTGKSKLGLGRAQTRGKKGLGVSDTLNCP